MKLQLDTTNKIIKIEEKVNLDELFNLLETILPNGLWKEFQIETNTIINWIEPIKINPIGPYVPYIPDTTPCPYPWWGNPIITCSTDKTTFNLNSGVYNIIY